MNKEQIFAYVFMISILNAVAFLFAYVYLFDWLKIEGDGYRLAVYAIISAIIGAGYANKKLMD